MSAVSPDAPSQLAAHPGPVRHLGSQASSTPGSLRRSYSLLLPFAAFAIYGMVRWQTLLEPWMRVRLAGVLALGLISAALLIVAVRGAGRWRAPACGASVLAVVFMIPAAGLPLSWLRHLRITLIGRTLGDGVSAIPNVLVPYVGGDRSTRVTIALGAGILIFLGGLALARAVAAGRERALVWAAVPLLVLAGLPSMLEQPSHVYLNGAITFVLMAALVFGERTTGRRSSAALALLALVTAVGVLVGTTITPSSAPYSFDSLVGRIQLRHVTSFDWTQGYGPLGPKTGNQVVLDVHARYPSYWKAEDLDEFDGLGWTSPATDSQQRVLENPLDDVSRESISRWSEDLTVTVRGMRTDQVIAAGAANVPALNDAADQVITGSQIGTWTVREPLGAGQRYSVSVYQPEPSSRSLRGEPADYPRYSVGGEMTMDFPSTAGPATLQFAPYGARIPVVSGSGATPIADLALLIGSPYGRAYALARSLERGTHTPYEYVTAVERYLQRNYKYERNPPRSNYPILGFLFGTHIGYCQQFAGAMALLLRMGGVPARVAVGFTTGSYDRAENDYVVRARDAHAWDEVWFPRYGWVTFDPTPPRQNAAAKAAQDAAARALTHGQAAETGSAATPGTLHRLGPAGTRGNPAGGAGGGLPWVMIGILLLLALGLIWVWVIARRLRARTHSHQTLAESLVGELEDAFASCRAPLPPGETLASLERALERRPQAAAYVARVRGLRFAEGAGSPSASERRAMRAYLRGRGGPLRRVRAWLALPPWGLH